MRKRRKASVNQVTSSHHSIWLAGLTLVPRVALHPDHLYVHRSVPEHLQNLLSQHGHHPLATSMMTVMNDCRHYFLADSTLLFCSFPFVQSTSNRIPLSWRILHLYYMDTRTFCSVCSNVTVIFSGISTRFMHVYPCRSHVNVESSRELKFACIKHHL